MRGVMKKALLLFFSLVLFSSPLTAKNSNDKQEGQATKQSPEETDSEDTDTEASEPPSTAQKIFYCVEGYNGPANLGWCKNGTFYGPIHLGSIGVSQADNDFTGGIQLGFYSAVGGRFLGILQIGLLLNDITEDFYGILQIGGLASVVRENYYGGFQLNGLVSGATMFFGMAQCAGILSIASDFYGFIQAGGLGALSANFNGMFQVGPYYTKNEKTFTGGLQIGFFTFVGTTFSDLVTMPEQPSSEDGFRGGFQLGAVNAATKFVGAGQLGAYNWSRTHYGLQVGVYNVSNTMHGAQLGVLNIADTLYGVQIGLINLAGNGLLTFMPVLNIGW